MITADEETSEEGDAEDKIKVGKLNLVDLAGSERQGKTGASSAKFVLLYSVNIS